MIITDRIYGRIDITDPLINELIQSAPLQRLKKISQDGAVHFIWPQLNVNRFEHSVGAWYLAKLFDRPIEEQVASLLHDVPHTAFSHVADYVMDDPNMEYHDRFLEQVVLQSEIPQICKKYHVDIHKVLQKEDYYLLDNKVPELSFDRWDYFMRDAYALGVLPTETIQLILSSAKLQNDHFYFEDIRVASQLCLTTLMVCQLLYAAPTPHGSYYLLAEALRIALKDGLLAEEDLFGTKETVWETLQSANNKDIDAYLARLQPGREFYRTPKESAEFYGRNKARYIDPLVKQGNELVRLSTIVPGLAAFIEAFKQQCQYLGVVQV